MRKVVIVGPPPVQVLDVTGPLEVFSNAPDYEIQLANPGLERTLQTNRGVVLADATPIAEVHGPIDTLVIAGGPGAESGSYDPNFIAWIAKAARQSRRVASICTGIPSRRSRSPQREASRYALDLLRPSCEGIPKSRCAARADLSARRLNLHIGRYHSWH